MARTTSTTEKRQPFVAQVSGALLHKIDREPQLAHIDRLSALSDTELAAMGLRRGGIAGSVLGNRFCY